MTLISDTKIQHQYTSARLAKDARFDGVFFTAVKTTGIYCRPICPANPPKEENVEYYSSSISAAESGFRPCLRCRPDSAPNSNAWIGTQVTLQRAVKLIDDGALQDDSLEALSDRLGVTSRHLRGLFSEHLGTSPKRYALHRQCLLAKQLLHQTDLPVTQIAFATGFNSVRRFNEVMQERLELTPTQIRSKVRSVNDGIELKLDYRPPFDWDKFIGFLQRRIIPGLEWVEHGCYGRTIDMEGTSGMFELTPDPQQHCVRVKLCLSDLSKLPKVIQRIRAVLDLDAPIASIEAHLTDMVDNAFSYHSGLRVPGVWATFESGVRAILGQQVSVKQAHDLVTLLVEELGESVSMEHQSARYLFPSPQAVANSELAFFRMPQSRKDTLRRLAKYMMTTEDTDDIDAWLDIKGIGPWTVNYVKLRATKDPDVWLDGDSGIKNALKLVGDLDTDQARPYRSYLGFQLWNLL